MTDCWVWTCRLFIALQQHPIHQSQGISVLYQPPSWCVSLGHEPLYSRDCFYFSLQTLEVPKTLDGEERAWNTIHVIMVHSACLLNAGDIPGIQTQQIINTVLYHPRAAFKLPKTGTVFTYKCKVYCRDAMISMFCSWKYLFTIDEVQTKCLKMNLGLANAKQSAQKNDSNWKKMSEQQHLAAASHLFPKQNLLQQRS